MSEKEILYYSSVGRRKRAVAQVRIALGKGKIEINGKKLNDYFPAETFMKIIQKPLELTDNLNKYDITAILQKGGLSGQAGAMSLGIARSLIKAEPQLRTALKKAGLLTRDPREKERKKYGQPGARKHFQFSKR